MIRKLISAVFVGAVTVVASAFSAQAAPIVPAQSVNVAESAVQTVGYYSHRHHHHRRWHRPHRVYDYSYYQPTYGYYVRKHYRKHHHHHHRHHSRRHHHHY